MDRDEALRKLSLAGKREEVMRVINEHVGRASRSYREIEADSRLSDSARREDLAKAFVRHEDALNRELSTMASRVGLDDQDDASRVFGTKGLSGDPASLTISMRDAADRVAQVGSQAELRELLDQATRTGDEVLARAIVRKAVESRYADVANAFIAARPHLESATERLWKAQRRDTGKMNYVMLISHMLPSGFKSFSHTRAVGEGRME